MQVQLRNMWFHNSKVTIPRTVSDASCCTVRMYICYRFLPSHTMYLYYTISNKCPLSSILSQVILSWNIPTSKTKENTQLCRSAQYPMQYTLCKVQCFDWNMSLCRTMNKGTNRRNRTHLVPSDDTKVSYENNEAN